MLKAPKGIQTLYVELFLMLVVISLGTVVLSIANNVIRPRTDFQTVKELEVVLLPSISQAIIVNWGPNNASVTLLCLLNNSLSEEKIFKVPAESSLLINMSCSGKEIFISGSELIPIVNEAINS